MAAAQYGLKPQISTNRIIRGSEDQKRYERDDKSMEDSVQLKGLSRNFAQQIHQQKHDTNFMVTCSGQKRKPFDYIIPGKESGQDRRGKVTTSIYICRGKPRAGDFFETREILLRNARSIQLIMGECTISSQFSPASVAQESLFSSISR